MKSKCTFIWILSLLFICMTGCSFSVGNGSGKIPTSDDIDGFFIKDGKLYDANGHIFQMRGVNVNHNWNASGRDNESLYYDSIPYIKATGANAVRIVFGPVEDNPWSYQCMTTKARRKVVEEYIKYRIVPVVEYHNGTGHNNPAVLQEAVDFWIGEKKWLADLERYVILNITNEWAKKYTDTDGYPASDFKTWAKEYKKAITRLRKAGIENLLVIDSFDYGHSLNCILEYGQDIIDHDSMHNVIFSIHAYGGWYSSQSAGVQNIEDHNQLNWSADYALDLLEDRKLAVIFGEFNRHCTLGVGGDCAPDNELIEDFNAHGAGWVFWMWWNWSGGGEGQMVDQSDSFNYTSCGNIISQYMKDSREATIFSDTPVPALP